MQRMQQCPPGGTRSVRPSKVAFRHGRNREMLSSDLLTRRLLLVATVRISRTSVTIIIIIIIMIVTIIIISIMVMIIVTTVVDDNFCFT